MIEAILIYILVGVLLTSVVCLNEINTIFDHWEERSVTKDELKEFVFLICTHVFGWGILFILMIRDVIKNRKEKKNDK